MRGAVRVPEVQDFANLTVKELINLTNLTIKKVEWTHMDTLSFTLSYGEHCSAGSNKVDKNHTFDPNKKITKVECIVWKNESLIIRMNFHSGQETLLKVGGYTDWYVKEHGGRVESFEIAHDEQLIGCELTYCAEHFHGVTWLKMKIPSC